MIKDREPTRCGMTGRVIPPEDAGLCNNAEGSDNCCHMDEDEVIQTDMCFAKVAFTIIAVVVLVVMMISMAHSAEYTNDQIANAIYKTENSKKYPYGVKSINTNGNEAYARKICLNSIRNARKSCVGQDLIVCMGNRYSPPATNPNWVRLVKHFLAKE